MKKIKVGLWENPLGFIALLVVTGILIFGGLWLFTDRYGINDEPEYSTEIAYDNRIQMVTAPDGTACIVLVMYDPFSGGIGVGIDCHN